LNDSGLMIKISEFNTITIETAEWSSENGRGYDNRKPVLSWSKL